ncbi:hypothetical protein [Phytoactinopolyspora endophytica]|uniref:hypothetical protein n=1 Tax=Phytoactinopolyspora endophytica TaxID=1642495 RepID=UPI00101B7BAE|nr:hypothetical protein [Phytoactinopolyspora endophytica]
MILFDGFNDALAIGESIEEASDYYRLRGPPMREIRRRAAEMLRNIVLGSSRAAVTVVAA